MGRTEINPGDRRSPAALLRDLDEPIDPAELAEVLALLDTFAAPDPPRGSSQALIERLRPLTPAPARRRFREEGLVRSPAVMLAAFLMAQVRLFRPAWWVGTALATLVWLLLSNLTGLTLTLLAPPLMAAGVTYGLRELGSPAMELEFSSAITPGQVILSRMLLVMAWVGLLGGAGAAVLPWLGHQVAFWPVLGAWTALMLLYGGIGLVALLWGGARVAFGVVLGAWLSLSVGPVLAPAYATWSLPNWAAAMLGAVLGAAALQMEGRLRRLPREEG